MLNIETKLTGNLAADLDKFEARIKESVVLSGVAAMARVIYNEVKLNTSPPRMGRKTGTLHDAIYRVYAADRSSEYVKVYRVSVNKSKAPHWHWLEYGNSRQAAHPYIRPAWDHVQEAIKAGNARMAERLSDGTMGLPT
jgi:HK97 gp10 family phage protein